MDLVAACRAFVAVADRGGFTAGAMAVRAPQSVVSRRVAALERHVGGPLFDRSTRRPSLTALGGDLLPAAARLLEAADALAHAAERAHARPLTLALPDACGVRELAALDAEARAGDGPPLELEPAPPAARGELRRARRVRAALLAVPPAEATWVVPLGVAGGSARADARGLRLEELRPSRAERTPRTLWLQPEDDVPHVRGEAERAGHRSGLAPSQVALARSLTAGVSAALGSRDLLLCPQAQAAALGLAWRPLRDPALARGYAVAAEDVGDAERLRGPLAAALAACLGAERPA